MPIQSLEDLIAERLAELPDRNPVTSPESPIRSTQKAALWRAGIHRAYSYLSRRIRDPWQEAEKAELERHYQQTLEEGPDFLKVRRTAEFAPVPVVAYRPEAAAEIMKQAREIERETYACRAKGKHGGGIGRTGIQLLEWFCFVMWPKARYGMFPSLTTIAKDARMSKETVTEAMKTLELFGFLTITRRRKRVETPLGYKQVQDTNCYVLNLARGLGALALAVFGKSQATGGKQGQPSESSKPPAKETPSYSTSESPHQFENLARSERRFSTA
jgi:hypothetical protein